MMDKNEWFRILCESCREVEDILADLRKDPATALAGEKLSTVFREYLELQGELVDEVRHSDGS